MVVPFFVLVYFVATATAISLFGQPHVPWFPYLWGGIYLVIGFGVLMLHQRLINNIRCRSCGEPVFRPGLFAVHWFRYHCPSCGHCFIEEVEGDVGESSTPTQDEKTEINGGRFREEGRRW
ncbi:hypothetical protein EG19_04585 [Thermoanaerobaculum aquaticum]|uniref:Uncharacterized protein n=1 Tax=Thermoanaerobaculum aquaticum TaxID=1312852 RepID=A0A062XYB0_9BACT|nr:hypothetical protein EG19_04585 [Thermoanaerobaculum aquaticum]